MRHTARMRLVPNLASANLPKGVMALASYRVAARTFRGAVKSSSPLADTEQ